MFKSQKTNNKVSTKLNNDQRDGSERKPTNSKSKTKDFFSKLLFYKSINSRKSKLSTEEVESNEQRNRVPIIPEEPENSILYADENEPSLSEQDLESSLPERIIRNSQVIDKNHLHGDFFDTSVHQNGIPITTPSDEVMTKLGDLYNHECDTQEDLKDDKTTNLKSVNKHVPIQRTDSSASWKILKVALLWTPFMQQYSKHRYPWIQIAGHQGNFKPGKQGTILKKHTFRESVCLQTMCRDILADFVPSFKGDVYHEGEKYICMQDLLAQFSMPSLMDIKMGIRTYLEEELGGDGQSCPKPRQDMYEKMIEVDENEPTEQEHILRAVIKSRYMQWRESLSSTLALGFRIEGIKKTGSKNNKNVGTQSRNFKRTKYRQEVKEALLDFIDNNSELPAKFIWRIKSLRTNLKKSSFFWKHEFIGSSLLFVHDKSGRANIWMIDFGKTIPLPAKFTVDHVSPWIEGNHEDGYLFGLDNLLSILEEIHSELSLNSN